MASQNSTPSSTTILLRRWSVLLPLRTAFTEHLSLVGRESWRAKDRVLETKRMMTVETATANGSVDASAAAELQKELGNGDSKTNLSISNGGNNVSKKLKETERRRRHRKPKKKNKLSNQTKEDADDSDVPDVDGDAKQNQAVEEVEVKYVPEKAELDDGLLEDFRKVLEKFTFKEPEGDEGDNKKDEADQDAAAKKKADSDSDEEEQNVQQKEKGLSNMKKKLQRRIKIAELKQIC